MKTKYQKLDQLISQSKKIVVLQADNPDGDSLASALALEQILAEMDKQVFLYCAVDTPEHLKHLAGWDRIEPNIPDNFDLAILVDCSQTDLLEIAQKTSQYQRLTKTPLVALDHHQTESNLSGAELIINDPTKVATGELIFDIASNLKWPLDKHSAGFLASSILSDTLGLTSEILINNSHPLVVMAKLIDLGADLSALNEARLSRLKLSPEVFAYKGSLMQRVEFYQDNQIASITITSPEIKEYSQKYNPTIVLDEMRFIEGVKVGIGFKTYQQQSKTVRMTARIRCNKGYLIAQELAEAFGGGGNPFASGIKWEDQNGLEVEEIRQKVIDKAGQLLADAS